MWGFFLVFSMPTMGFLSNIFRSKRNSVNEELRILINPSDHNGCNVCFDLKRLCALCIFMFHAIRKLNNDQVPKHNYFYAENRRYLQRRQKSQTGYFCNG
jgi:hypothetical protein